MGVQMGDALCLGDPGKIGSLGQINHVAQPPASARNTARAAFAASHGQTGGAHRMARMAQHPADGLGDDRGQSGAQDMVRFIIFCQIGGINQIAAIRPHGKAVHRLAQPFQRQNLTPDKAVRGARICVDQITEFQRTTVFELCPTLTPAWGKSKPEARQSHPIQGAGQARL